MQYESYRLYFEEGFGTHIKTGNPRVFEILCPFN